MRIEIGSVVRNLRAKAKVTQEMLANHLGISVQAVSRWESGVCYPDLEFIPAIAAYFSVSTDCLLCVDKLSTIQAEENFIRQWTEAFNNAEHQKALDIINNALLSMPTNYRLMLLKAESILVLSAISEESGDMENYTKMLLSAKDLLHLIHMECNDNAVRFQALEWMIALECNAENKTKVLELSKEFPDVKQSKNSMLYRCCFWNDNEKQKFCREYLYELFFEFFYCARTLAKSDSVCDSDKLKIQEGLLCMLQVVVGGDVYGEFEYLLDELYRSLYELTKKEEYKQNIGIHAERYKALPDKHIYRSVFLKGVVFERKKTIHSIDGSI